MSQSLIISWTSPIPSPACGFTAAYRANGIPSYTTINTSGNTSGETISIPSLSPACYEGYIESNCCGTSLSANSPFGVNSWQPLYANLVYGQTTVTLNITTAYPNPYNSIISGGLVFVTSGGTTVRPFTLHFPAGTTIISGSDTKYSDVATITISAITPSFDNGGALQQYDSVATPQYFQFYNTSGCTSGSTSGCTIPSWNGSPIVLPSFILRAFNVTATDISGTKVIAGDIIVSWIQHFVYQGGSGIYSHVTFNVYDPDTSLMGSITIPAGQVGLNTVTIPISLVISPISTSTEFTMTTQWSDESVSASELFYLPNF